MRFTLYGGMVVIVLLLSTAVLAEEGTISSSVVENPWEGTWTDGNSTLTIEQNGTEVSGVCEPIDPETGEQFLLSGTISDDGTELNGTISDTGKMELILSEDLMEFNATVTIDRIGNMSEDDQYTINATRQESLSDQEKPYAGTWKTQHSLFTIAQDETELSGTNRQLTSPEEGGEFNGTVIDDGKAAILSWKTHYDLPLRLADDGLSMYELDCGEEEIKNGELCLNMSKME